MNSEKACIAQNVPISGRTELEWGKMALSALQVNEKFHSKKKRKVLLHASVIYHLWKYEHAA